MINYVRHYLGAKLLVSYVAIIGIAVLVLIVASQFILPSAFNRHMSGMMGNGMSMMNGQGSPNGTTLYADFRDGFNEALKVATMAAIAVAAVVSVFLTRSVTAPVEAMSHATQRIAEGRYEERVEVRGEDELARLAIRFNQMAQTLSETDSMRRQLIGDVSHELRTPLTAIQGSMEGLMDGILPATKETYQEIHAEANRLNRLVEDLQELSRVESRAYLLNIKPVDISSLVKTVTKRLAPQAESKHIRLDVQLIEGLPQVLADEDRAIQVMTNLTGNALQYTPKGGRVILSAQQAGDEVQVMVRDNGAGIPAEHLVHIFDRFYRVDKSRSRQAGGGSGIGLTIARALVEAQDGRMWAESAGDGQGSTFYFTLPAAK